MASKESLHHPDIIAVSLDTDNRDKSKRDAATAEVDILSVYVEGGPKYVLNGNAYDFDPPAAILIPKGTLDEDMQCGKIRGIYTLFEGRGLVSPIKGCAHAVCINLSEEAIRVPVFKALSPANGARLFSLLNEIREIPSAGPANQLKRISRLYEALAEYASFADAGDNKSIHREAVRLRELIQTFAFENTSLTQIYRETDLSAAYAETLFRKAFGIKPVEYRMQLRMMRARELLASSRLNVSQVAYKVGFTDPLYFSKIFRKTHGVSPSSLITSFTVSRMKASGGS